MSTLPDISFLAGVVIPLVSIVLGVIFGMWLAYLNYRRRKEFFELHHKERMAAIEKGIEVPPLPESIFTGRPSGFPLRDPRRSLLNGLFWMFVGLAVVAFLQAQNSDTSPLLGLIGMAMGLAHLIYYAVETRRSPAPPAMNPPPR